MVTASEPLPFSFLSSSVLGILRKGRVGLVEGAVEAQGTDTEEERETTDLEEAEEGEEMVEDLADVMVEQIRCSGREE